MGSPDSPLALTIKPLLRRLLEAYDHAALETLDLEALARAAARDPGEAAPGCDAMRAAVTELVRLGWLRPAGAPDTFTRGEDGRLAVAGPRDITLYTRPDCHLCEEAKAQIAPLAARFGVRLREVNIDADPVLRERYTDDVPVIFLGPRKVAKHRVNVEQFRRRLERAGG